MALTFCIIYTLLMSTFNVFIYVYIYINTKESGSVCVCVFLNIDFLLHFDDDDEVFL